MSIRVFLGVLLLLTPSLALAAPAPGEVEPTCDITVQDQMKQQGWLEGQREMEMAQRLILKPDSTLEYTCFKQEADNWGAKAGKFSDMGGGTPPGDSPDLSKAIKTLVTDSLGTYLTNNYGHLFLGGTYEEEGAQFITQLANPDGECNPQYWIWFLAKCVNSPVNSEGRPAHFFPLSTLMNRDIRSMPQTCPAPEKDARNTRLQETQQKQDKFPDATKNPPYGVDNASHIKGTSADKLYTEMLSTCGDAVKTGLKVIPLQGTTVYDDAVCIAPGCSYMNGRCQ